jgi:serine/threonine-protein phosphatase 2A activator
MKLSAMLDIIRETVMKIEPIDQPMRFGNKAFRTFHSWLSDSCEDLLHSADLGEISHELRPYLLDSFGNSVRIDYGTGHEAAFLMFLIVLLETKKLQLSEHVILAIFREYVSLVRLITSRYTMEPAGSHGVWGLDDYHHLPFVFGAAQLIGHEGLVKPSTVFDHCNTPELSESLYADMIGFLKRTKCMHARFHEVAPLLFDFTRCENWSQVCLGLFRMYKVEVLGKRPIVQHFVFGNVLRWAKNE